MRKKQLQLSSRAQRGICFFAIPKKKADSSGNVRPRNDKFGVFPQPVKPRSFLKLNDAVRSRALQRYGNSCSYTEGCPLRCIGSSGLWTAHGCLDIVGSCSFCLGKTQRTTSSASFIRNIKCTGFPSTSRCERSTLSI